MCSQALQRERYGAWGPKLSRSVHGTGQTVNHMCNVYCQVCMRAHSLIPSKLLSSCVAGGGWGKTNRVCVCVCIKRSQNDYWSTGVCVGGSNLVCVHLKRSQN